MASIAWVEGSIQLTGDIDFQTVVALRAEGESLITQRSASKSGAAKDDHQVMVDMAGVGVVNTAAMALLISWHRMAKKQGVCLAYKNVPASLVAISQMSDLESLLS